MRRYFILFIILLFSPLYAIGFNVNFALDAGLAECLSGKQVEKNLSVLNDFPDIGKYINYGGMVSADVLFLKNQDVEVGLEIKKVNLNFLPKEGNIYANGATTISFSLLRIPIMYKISIPLSNTNDFVNSIDVAAGVNASFILGNESYKDEISTGVGKFFNRPYNFGFSLKVAYTQKIGPGIAFAGLYGDVNFLPYSYSTQNNVVDIGRTFTISPIIGYTFKIKEDTYQSKVKEKSKRIKDIEVQ